MTDHTSTPAPDALRADLVDTLTEAGAIRSEAVRAAFMAVPRHRFLPGVPAEEAYANKYVVTHRRGGADISSASQPDVVAMMLEQADVRPGMRVLEIGAGTGYNAALLDELVGPGGSVVTIDIEPEVTAAARTHLEATGHGRVRVITGDGAEGTAGEPPFDRIIATTGVWDIPPAWWDQLAKDGRMVVPLRWRGLTRSLALDHIEGRLVARDVRLCGFIPMQGQDGEQTTTLAEGVAFHYDQDAPADPAALGKVLEADRVEAWSGVRITGETPLEGVWMRLAGAEPGTGRMVTKPPALGSGLVSPAIPPLNPGVAEGGSFAYLSVRRAEGNQPGLELGAVGHGPRGAELARQICKQAAVWDAARDAVPQVMVYPAAADVGARGAVVEKQWSQVALSW
ncbi:methyltransferase, FxLD system [Nocardiopsis sp. CNT-189]|uniref:methyltransferase, FxLD system n=1 Tax=Nocardiopsis oceanisediminis TaxID=2816862 RepID=UPI003B2F2D7E